MRNRTKRLGLTVPRRKPRKRTTSRSSVDAPNLCRRVGAPGELLVSDFTYILLDRGFAYFAVTLRRLLPEAAGLVRRAVR